MGVVDGTCDVCDWVSESLATGGQKVSVLKKRPKVVTPPKPLSPLAREFKRNAEILNRMAKQSAEEMRRQTGGKPPDEFNSQANREAFERTMRGVEGERRMENQRSAKEAFKADEARFAREAAEARLRARSGVDPGGLLGGIAMIVGESVSKQIGCDLQCRVKQAMEAHRKTPGQGVKVPLPPIPASMRRRRGHN